jgi:hypothetical protein
MDDERIHFAAGGQIAPLGAGYWSGTLAAPAWGKLVKPPNSGVVAVEIEIPNGHASGRPSPTQIAACVWFTQHEAEMVDAVLAAIFGDYPRLQAIYDYPPEEAAHLMPPIRQPRDLLSLIDLRSLSIHDVINGALPYIGFTFGCTWDSEHQLGVLMHGTRAVGVGDGDMAFDWHAPRRDAAEHPM